MHDGKGGQGDRFQGSETRVSKKLKTSHHQSSRAGSKPRISTLGYWTGGDVSKGEMLQQTGDRPSGIDRSCEIGDLQS